MNIYTHFAFVIENITPAESNWCDSRLALLDEFFAADNFTRETEFTSLTSIYPYDHGARPFNFTHGFIHGKPCLNLFSDGEGDPQVLATFLWEFLSLHRPTETFTFTYAETTSRPIPGAFAGGAIHITAAAWDEFHVTEWLTQKASLCAAL